MASEKIKVNVYLSPVMIEALKKLAAKQDRPYAAIIREACRDYLVATVKASRERKAHGKPAPDAQRWAP